MSGLFQSIMLQCKTGHKRWVSISRPRDLIWHIITGSLTSACFSVPDQPPWRHCVWCHLKPQLSEWPFQPQPPALPLWTSQFPIYTANTMMKRLLSEESERVNWLFQFIRFWTTDRNVAKYLPLKNNKYPPTYLLSNLTCSSCSGLHWVSPMTLLTA